MSGSAFENSIKRKLYVLAEVKDSDECAKLRKTLAAAEEVIYWLGRKGEIKWCHSCGSYAHVDDTTLQIDTCEGCDMDCCIIGCAWRKCSNGKTFHLECKEKAKCTCKSNEIARCFR